MSQMEYTSNSDMVKLVEGCMEDGQGQGFKCIVIYVDTLYRLVYYYPFGSFLSAARHITSDPNCLAHRRVVVLKDEWAWYNSRVWAKQIGV